MSIREAIGKIKEATNMEIYEKGIKSIEGVNSFSITLLFDEDFETRAKQEPSVIIDTDYHNNFGFELNVDEKNKVIEIAIKGNKENFCTITGVVFTDIIEEA